MNAVLIESLHRKSLSAAVILVVASIATWAAELGSTRGLTPGLISTMVSRFGTEARPRLNSWAVYGRDESQRGPNADIVPSTPGLQRINSFLNRVPYREDINHWGVEDYWATPAETVASNGGDCEDVCTPNAKECDAGMVKQCNATGVGQTMVDDCLMKDMGCDQGACVTKGCDVGTKCDGSKLLECDENQLKWQSTDCAASNKICFDGACEEKPCSANQTGCMGDVVVKCNATATEVSEVEDCFAKTTDDKSWTCDKGACVAKVCAFLDSKCDGKLKYVCNDAGTGFELAEDCGKSGAACVDGKCAPPPCAANKLGCENATNVVQCDANGGFALVKTCGTGTVCDNGACVTQVCKPFDSYCEGNVVMDCNDKGTAGAKSTDCSSNGEACFEGLCGPVVCAPNATFCSQGKQATCTATGGGFAESDCPSGQFCTGGACQPAICNVPASWSAWTCVSSV